MTLALDSSPARALAQRWTSLRAAEPKLRVRDAAIRLGVSELELIASGGALGVARLETRWADLLPELQTLGPALALTRNAHVVHEKTGVYSGVEIMAGGAMGLALGEAIDLRLFLSRWRHAYAVTDLMASGVRSSLQFFSADGAATHKVYLTEESDRAAYDALVERFRAADPATSLEIAPPEAEPTARPDAEIDRAGFRAAWDAMTDTHDFFGMLRKFGVTRPQALRLAGLNRAVAVDATAPRRILEQAARTGLPIMVFTGNPGTLQIHTGPINVVRVTGPWVNVLDPGFNLHLKETAIDAVWLVRKPTADGVVTSIELFDASGALITTFFGKRKPGQPEDPSWRALAESMAA